MKGGRKHLKCWALLFPPFRVYSFTNISAFHGGSGGKDSDCKAGDPGSIPGWRRSPGGEHGEPSILAWRISGAEEPGELQFMGLQRVEHD